MEFFNAGRGPILGIFKIWARLSGPMIVAGRPRLGPGIVERNDIVINFQGLGCIMIILMDLYNMDVEALCNQEIS